MGNFIVWDADKGKIVKSKNEPFSVWSGVLVTAGGIACYGTLEGYLKCVDADDVTKELYRFKTPSGIIGNVNTWEYKGRQYIGVLSGIGGWAGVGLADPSLKKETDGLGAVGAYKGLTKFTEQGGVLTVFAVPDRTPRATAQNAAHPHRAGRRPDAAASASR
jgi:glucose dehydrogenase